MDIFFIAFSVSLLLTALLAWFGYVYLRRQGGLLDNSSKDVSHHKEAWETWPETGLSAESANAGSTGELTPVSTDQIESQTTLGEVSSTPSTRSLPEQSDTESIADRLRDIEPGQDFGRSLVPSLTPKDPSSEVKNIKEKLAQPMSQARRIGDWDSEKWRRTLWSPDPMVPPRSPVSEPIRRLSDLSPNPPIVSPSPAIIAKSAPSNAEREVPALPIFNDLATMDKEGRASRGLIGHTIAEEPPDWLTQAPDPEEPDVADWSWGFDGARAAASRHFVPIPEKNDSFWTARHHIAELHYLTLIVNVESILRQGILSHNAAQQYGPETVAMPEVQSIRSRKRLPSGRVIHDYANLYFNARNPMMFKRKEQHAQLCILRISTDVLGLKDAYIADGNAASGSTRFTLVSGLGLPIDEDMVFGESWYNPDAEIFNENRRRRCAELLVPEVIDPRHITGAYVSTLDVRARLEQWMSRDMIRINERMFFYRSR